MKVTVVFDIGRTNKKYVLFDKNFQIVEEYSEVLPEITDEDGFPCDDLTLLSEWLQSHWNKIRQDERFEVVAVNATAYGASFVHLDAENKPLTPLYSYLKPLPKTISEKYYSTYGSPKTMALQTGSPELGMLNSGLQIYWLKYARPEIYKQIKTSLHLPQYIIYLLTGRQVSEYTSIGCHTALWNFEMMDYHPWVKAEEINNLFPPLLSSSSFIHRDGGKVIQSGFGMHDSSSALLPYRIAFKEPFVLLSTGTWCINFNPFNAKPLTFDQLEKDCLHYMNSEGSGVKASRIFLGREHDHQVSRIAAQFDIPTDFYKKIEFNPQYLQEKAPVFIPACMEGNGPMPEKQTGLWNISGFGTAESAYHHLLAGLTDLLAISLRLVGAEDVESIYIDGGFARNPLFTKLIKAKFPNQRIYSTDLPYATALGAALYVQRPQDFEFPGKNQEV